MSWFKKIGRKKNESTSEQAANAADETVLFSIDAEPSKPAQSRSSMISELAGLDPELSADLSGELGKQRAANSGSSLIEQYADNPSMESIDLGNLDLGDSGDEDSSHHATASFGDDIFPVLPELDDESGQQETAIFNAGNSFLAEPDSGQHKTAIFNASDSLPTEPDSGQHKTVIFSDNQLDTESSISLDDPRFASLKPAAPPPQANAIPELDFDSHSGLDMDSGQNASLEFDDSDASMDIGLIDQLAGGFDLDLSLDEEPTIEIPSSNFPSHALPPGDIDATIAPTAEPFAPEPEPEPEPEPDFNDATSEQSIDFENLATAKLPEPILPVAPKPTAPAKTPELNEPVDFDATVITTAAVAPAVAAGADYVTGWVIVIDGPGKGQSRPIFSGINPIGRSPDQAIPLYFGGKSDGEISRRDHTRIVYDPRGNHFKLQHGASRNLTYLNDEPVLEIVDLKPYDRIGLGKSILLFVPMCGDQFRW